MSGLVVGVSGKGWHYPVRGPWRWGKKLEPENPPALGQEVVLAFAPSCVPLDYGTLAKCAFLPSLSP